MVRERVVMVRERENGVVMVRERERFPGEGESGMVRV